MPLFLLYYTLFGLIDMNDKQAHIKELADIVFDGKPARMAYLRERISKLTDEEMLELVQKIDSVFQQYAENI